MGFHQDRHELLKKAVQNRRVSIEEVLAIYPQDGHDPEDLAVMLFGLEMMEVEIVYEERKPREEKEMKLFKTLEDKARARINLLDQAAAIHTKRAAEYQEKAADQEEKAAGLTERVIELNKALTLLLDEMKDEESGPLPEEKEVKEEPKEKPALVGDNGYSTCGDFLLHMIQKFGPLPTRELIPLAKGRWDPSTIRSKLSRMKRIDKLVQVNDDGNYYALK